jgi:flagellar basal-body rod protein FlgB
MDAIFGLSEKALAVSEERATLLSSNLVNSATPNYKAKDIDFDKIMKNINEASTLHKTNSKHIATAAGEINGAQVQYRIPMQISMDGNTVDPEIERKNFLENSMKYQVSLTFIQNRTDEIMKAIKGE